MTQLTALARPDAHVRSAVGNDGLTDAERAIHAEAYHAGVGRKSIAPAAIAAMNAVRGREAQ